MIIEDIKQIDTLCLDLAEVMDKQVRFLNKVDYDSAVEMFMEWSDSCDLAFNSKIIGGDDALAEEVRLTLQLKALSRGYQLVEWLKIFPTTTRTNTRKRKQATRSK